jgi:hypothetical protein
LSSARTSPWRDRLSWLGPLALLVVSLWVVRYLRSAEFGFYEDDFTHIPPAVQMSRPDLAAYVADLFRNLGGQGTPLKLTLWAVLARAGWGLAGLRGLYLLAFAVLALNVSLFYFLVKKVSDPAVALCAGLAYVLYSADTTQAFLSHAYILQTSIAMLLVSLLLYHGGNRILAYAVILLTLLTYETTFTVFLAAPLLTLPWDRAWRNQVVRHLLACGAILAAVVALRFAAGENRVGGLMPGDLFLVPISHMLVGPPVALGTYFYRPVQALLAGRADVWLAAAAGALGFTWVLFHVRPGFTARWTDLSGVPRRLWTDLAGTSHEAGDPRAGFGPDLLSRVRLALVGAVMLILAYPLTFTVRPYAISGRDTRVHAAGVVGASILTGSALVVVLAVAEGYQRRRWAVPILGVFLGALAGYGFVLQDDYAMAWRLQRDFVGQLVPLIPDVGDGTVVLLDPAGLTDTRQIGANYWNLPRVLAQVFTFPSTWEAKPRIYRLVENWRERISTGDGRVRLDAATTMAPPGTYATVDADKVILVRYRDGRLQREAAPFTPDSSGPPLPVAGGGEPPYPHGLLYDLMVAPAGRAPASGG